MFRNGDILMRYYTRLKKYLVVSYCPVQNGYTLIDTDIPRLPVNYTYEDARLVHINYYKVSNADTLGQDGVGSKKWAIDQIESCINKVFSKSCQHSFKEYVGFTESFKYCTKCDTKE